MGQRKWKKIVLVFGVIFLLLFSFWYGGNSAGLQGFSAADNQETISPEKEDSDSFTSKDTGNKEESTAEEKNQKGTDNIFKQIVMHITKKSSSFDTSNNTQNNKKAQKNANQAASKSKKEKKKSSNSLENKVDSGSSQNDENDSNNSGQNTESAKQDQDADSNNTTENHNSNTVQETDTITCTISISCAVLLDNMETLSAAKKKLVPSDGTLLKTTTVKMKDGSTVFDALRQVTKENKVHLEYSFTPMYKSYYIEGIGNLYQFDGGELSGWMYSVNGEFPGNGCSSYTVKSGDVIQWVYTCNLGKDVGSYFEE